MRYHSYTFFDSEPSVNSLGKPDLDKGREEFIKILSSSSLRVRAYATLAMKPSTRFMLHINADTPEEIQLLIRDLLHTKLGRHLSVKYALLGLTRSSQYNPKHAPKEADWDLPHKYLVVYPFTKTVEWHLMPYEDRRNIMKAHVDVGRKHSDKISQRLVYSFGIDDNEFIVSYYMDDLEDFVQLVMDMRETESRRYTKNDLPIFTCIHMPINKTLEMI